MAVNKITASAKKLNESTASKNLQNTIYYANGAMSDNYNPNTVKKTTTTSKKTTSTPSSTPTATPVQAVQPVDSYDDGGSESYDGGNAYADAMSEYTAQIEEMLARQKAEAQSAYDNSMNRLNQAWGNTQSNLSNNLNSTLGSLRSNYDYTVNQANDDAAKSLREAYVNYMMNKKNLNQNLSAAGLSGGATESTMANMYNNYGSSRNDINNTLAQSIRNLANTYNSNVAAANQQYNSEYANAMNNYVANQNNLESQLAQNLISNYSGSALAGYANYANALASIAQAQAQASYTPTTNNYGVNTVSTQSANNTGSITDYAKYLAMVQNQAKSGDTAQNIIQNLVNSGASLNDIYSLYGVSK